VSGVLHFFSGQDPKIKSFVFEGSTTENQSGSTPDKVRFLKFNLLMFPWLRAFFWWLPRLFCLETSPLL
jgi:hypothetical protein